MVTEHLGQLGLFASRYTRVTWWGNIIHLFGSTPPKMCACPPMESQVSKLKEICCPVDPDALFDLDLFVVFGRYGGMMGEML